MVKKQNYDGWRKNLDVVLVEIRSWLIFMEVNWKRWRRASWDPREKENKIHVGHNFRTESIRELSRMLSYLTYLRWDLPIIYGIGVWLWNWPLPFTITWIGF